MSRILALVVVLTTGFVMAAYARPVNPLVVCDFEKESDLVRFKIRTSTPPSKMTLVKGRSGKGDKAAAIFFPRWQQDSEQWPAAILTAEKGLPVDWSAYNSVACHVYNASPTEVDLGLYAFDAAGKRAVEHFSLPPKQSRTMRLAFDSIPPDFDLKHVRELHVFGTRPPDDLSVVVDDIRLESDVMPRLKDIKAAIAWLKRTAKPYASETGALLAELDAKYAELESAASQAADAAALQALRPDVVAFQNRLDVQSARAIAEAKLKLAARKRDPNAVYACGFASSMHKVFPRDVAFECSTAPEVKLELAGDETESAQLLIYAFGRDLKGAKVEISPLVSANGKRGPFAQASPVGFVETKKPPYPVRYVGWHPDPILDFLHSFDVKKGEVQPVWIRVKTPRDTPPGEYTARITVRPANAAQAKLSLKVHVYGFNVPEERHLRTAMSLYAPMIKNAYGSATTEMADKYEDFVLSYRINPDEIYRRSAPEIRDLVRWNKLGLNAFNIVHVTKLPGTKAGDPYPPEAKQAILEKLDAVVPQLKAKGLYSKAYVYGFDEVSPDSYAAMKDVFGAIKAKYPDLMIMTTGRDNSYGEASGVDAVDAWCPLTPYFDPERVQKARERGKQVWWYICVSPRAPYANWLIEYDAIDARMLMGVQTAKYQPDGFLYYAMMRWPLTKKPITGGPYTDWPPASYNDCNGDGSIICAGPDGPLATIRLENIRDGIEDYEYFWLLRHEMTRIRDYSSAAARDAYLKAEKALAVGSGLVENMSSFNRSPETLLAKRRHLAEAISAAMKIRR